MKRANRHLILLAVILAIEGTTIGFAGLLAPSPLPALLALPILPCTVLGFIVTRRLAGGRPRMRRLSPEDIVRGTGTRAEALVPTPKAISRSIVERAEEIQAAMQNSPSEVRVEMCSLGYRACANDMLTLTHLVNDELRSAGPLRRMRLRLYRRRAVEALSSAREALPPGALRTTRQEQP